MYGEIVLTKLLCEQLEDLHPERTQNVFNKGLERRRYTSGLGG
jgi:hypothetical protein